MYERLLHFLNEFNILYKFQFVNRKDCSTNMALITLMNKLTTALENGEFTVRVFLDFLRPLIQLITKYIIMSYQIFLVISSQSTMNCILMILRKPCIVTFLPLKQIWE